MRRTGSILLTILGAGGAALGYGIFGGSDCRDRYDMLEKCAGRHGGENCTVERQADGTEIAFGPAKRCPTRSGYHSYFGPGFGSHTYGGVGSGTPSYSAPSARGGFGGTGSGFSFGS